LINGLTYLCPACRGKTRYSKLTPSTRICKDCNGMWKEEDCWHYIRKCPNGHKWIDFDYDGKCPYCDFKETDLKRIPNPILLKHSTDKFK